MDPKDCKCEKPATLPAGAKNCWKCPTCDQTWIKDPALKNWRRIARFRYEELVGQAPKPRKPRAKKADLGKVPTLTVPSQKG